MAQDTVNHRRPHQDQEQAPLKESCAMHDRGGLRAMLGDHHDVNVGDVERVLSVMGGGLLTVFGAARGGLTGLGLAVLGGSLLYRGVTGHCEAYHSLGIDTSDSADTPVASDLGRAHS
ncbi:MAG: hypothetical protein BGO49_17920 [Planctomycetales bacterium 71-10]|nr:MAG: hypothetical protein BGO49_17920 [Planctomycetales bacterium 71-10]